MPSAGVFLREPSVFAQIPKITTENSERLGRFQFYMRMIIAIFSETTCQVKINVKKDTISLDKFNTHLFEDFIKTFNIKGLKQNGEKRER